MYTCGYTQNQYITFNIIKIFLPSNFDFFCGKIEETNNGRKCVSFTICYKIVLGIRDWKCMCTCVFLNGTYLKGFGNIWVFVWNLKAHSPTEYTVSSKHGSNKCLHLVYNSVEA